MCLLVIFPGACTAKATPQATEFASDAPAPPTAEVHTPAIDAYPEPTAVGTAQSGSIEKPTASPTILPGVTPPSAIPSLPSATEASDAAGLPCPSATPSKPEYASYTVSSHAWPTPDPYVALPLMLSDPLPGAERNHGYPYGSDGSGRYLIHNGLDLADADNGLAGAVAPGTVIVARADVDEQFGWRCDWYGQLVVLRLDAEWEGEPVYVLYGHVSDVQVTENQHVEQGDPIARKGSAGVAVVPHLHLEVRVGVNEFAATQNPTLWLKPADGTGLIAGRLIDPDGNAWEGVVVTLIDRRGELPFLNTWTYLDDPQSLIRPNPGLAENFVFGPVPAGTYDVYVSLQGVAYRQSVEVRAGQLTPVEIITQPGRLATPEPTATP